MFLNTPKSRGKKKNPIKCAVTLFPFFLLGQCFSTRVDVTPREHLAMSKDICGCHGGGWGEVSKLWVEAEGAA